MSDARWFWRLAGRLMSPGGRRGRLSTLIFHRVAPAPDPMRPDMIDQATFERLMTFVATCFNVLPASEAVERLRAGNLPPRSLCITFDDGYADNVEIALPVLQRLALPATFFIATDYLDGGRAFSDSIVEILRRIDTDVLDLAAEGLGTFVLSDVMARRTASAALVEGLKYRSSRERTDITACLIERFRVDLPGDLMMTRKHVRELTAAGMELGNHTASHPILTRIERHAAEADIAAGRDVLQEIAARPIELFAYPNGKPGIDYSAEHAALVRRMGFKAAFSTSWGSASSRSDPYQLPRFTPWDRHPARFAARLLLNYRRSEERL